MVDRIKMSREDRAKQFAPFDALKGLQNALRLKEYEHDKMVKNEMCEDSIKEISNVLANLKKYDNVKIKFFQDGHNFNVEGKCEIDINFQTIKVGAFLIRFDDILEIKRLES